MFTTMSKCYTIIDIMEKENIIKQILSTNAKIEHSLHGGMMNESYLVKDTNKKYVLYMPTKQANEMVDRSLEAYNHSLVYPLGITSKNIYFNVDEGIKINEFIKGNSLNHENVYDVTRIADLLKTLHTKAPLTYKEYNPFERLANFEKERQLTNIELDIHYNDLRDIVFNNIDFLKEDKLCLSHNDFQKSNIIKTKQDNYFVIDFEFMMNNYESYAIACFATDNLIDGINLLKAYKKR